LSVKDVASSFRVEVIKQNGYGWLVYQTHCHWLKYFVKLERNIAVRADENGRVVLPIE
jgi:hypothetical protein